MSVTSKLRRPLVLALAAGALAVGVPAALAAGGGDDGGGGSSGRSAAPQPGFVQEGGRPQQGDRQQPRDGHPCPERDGNGGSSGSGEQGSGTATDAPTV